MTFSSWPSPTLYQTLELGDTASAKPWMCGSFQNALTPGPLDAVAAAAGIAVPVMTAVTKRAPPASRAGVRRRDLCLRDVMVQFVPFGRGALKEPRGWTVNPGMRPSLVHPDCKLAAILLQHSIVAADNITVERRPR